MRTEFIRRHAVVGAHVTAGRVADISYDVVVYGQVVDGLLPESPERAGLRFAKVTGNLRPPIGDYVLPHEGGARVVGREAAIAHVHADGVANEGVAFGRATGAQLHPVGRPTGDHVAAHRDGTLVVHAHVHVVVVLIGLGVGQVGIPAVVVEEVLLQQKILGVGDEDALRLDLLIGSSALVGVDEDVAAQVQVDVGITGAIGLGVGLIESG